MWLLNIETKKLEYFEGRSIPPYAILSHRWTCDEVSFQDVINGAATLRSGWLKIDNFCTQVCTDGIPVAHVWIDTCCIDKSNNSELSEAINSMYKWYLQAEVCYAYLADVSSGNEIEFRNSAWFRRGWTLQELLAPNDVQFFDQNWRPLGTKLELGELITQITGIPPDALEHFDSRRSRHSVADRMSWAAQRQTTREEDTAYCLFGLFGVNMPLLYGEGARAFLRLQEEILKTSEDLSIFAWSKFPKISVSNDYIRYTSIHDFGLFAASPESFGHQGQQFRNLIEGELLSRDTHLDSALSGAGLAINMVLVPFCPGMYIIPLCEVFQTIGRQVVATGKIAAMFVERTRYEGRYRRIVYNAMCVIIDRPEYLNLSLGRTQRIVLERLPYHDMAKRPRDKYGFNILQIEDDILRLFQVTGRDSIDILKRNSEYSSLFLEPGEVGVAGMIRLGRRNISPIYFHFGFDYDFNPFCLISRPTHRGMCNEEYKLVYESSIKHVVSVECNIGILQLVSLLQADSRKFNLQRDNMELHMGSWQSQEMQFVGRDCRVGLDVSAGHEDGYVYHVHIGLAHKDYPWAAPPEEKKWNIISKQSVVWHSEPWHNHKPG